METSEQGQLLLIGKDIPWKAIEGSFCKVIRFTPFATVEAGKIKGVPLNKPYAMLTVEIPAPSYVSATKARFFVSNKVDFRNLWEVFQQRGVSAEEEVLVGYEPFFGNRLLRFILSAGMPRLHIFIFPEGWLRRSLSENYDPSLSWEPIAEWRPPYHGHY